MWRGPLEEGGACAVWLLWTQQPGPSVCDESPGERGVSLCPLEASRIGKPVAYDAAEDT